MKNSFKETCINLRRKDYTLNEIVEITGRPKTSVYFHIESIPLSKKRQEKIVEERTNRINKYSLSIKGKSLKDFKKIRNFDNTSVTLLSHLLFDGQIIRSGCIYHNRSETLINIVRDCMKDFYLYEPKITKDKVTGVTRISYHNVALANHFKEKTEKLLEDIFLLPVMMKKSFLKSFFDDEGSVRFKKGQNRKEVRGYQYDYDILLLVQKLLKDLNIESRVSKKFNEVTISKKDNLEKFYKEINFSDGVRVNGKRKNSIWKRDLEKREILKMAIDSYQS